MFGFGKKRRDMNHTGSGRIPAAPAASTDRQREAFVKRRDDEIEIYVHIPFCLCKCLYCDFLSGVAQSEAQQLQYFADLKREIVQTAGQLETKRFRVRSVFFGGGTPSAAAPELLTEVLDTIRENFNLSERAEITLEANPGTLSAEGLAEYRRAGFNRISIGIQSADDALLAVLGRIHRFADAKAAVRLAREAGFDNISVDLMSGLPGQTLESWHDTLEQVLALQPEHISAYSLIIEEGTPFAERYGGAEGAALLPDEDTERQMYYDTEAYLSRAGYRRYEISNYAKTGRECVHNLGYWQGVDYLGFGLGASSLWDRTRYQNEKSHQAYHEAVWRAQLAGLHCDVTKLGRRECMEEHMFLGLRCMEGISKRGFEEKFGVVYETVLGPPTARLLHRGLIETDGDRIRLTKLGIDVSNQVFSEFLLEEDQR